MKRLLKKLGPYATLPLVEAIPKTKVEGVSAPAKLKLAS
jgi:hypothetical protein